MPCRSKSIFIKMCQSNYTGKFKLDRRVCRNHGQIILAWVALWFDCTKAREDSKGENSERSELFFPWRRVILKRCLRLHLLSSPRKWRLGWISNFGWRVKRRKYRIVQALVSSSGTSCHLLQRRRLMKAEEGLGRIDVLHEHPLEPALAINRAPRVVQKIRLNKQFRLKIKAEWRGYT